MMNWHHEYGHGVKSTYVTPTRKRSSAVHLPPVAADWSPGSLKYLDEHGLDFDFIDQLRTVYATDGGIVFVLIGNGISYQVRYTDERQQRFSSSPGESVDCIFVPTFKLAEHPPLISPTLALCEGPADALALRQEGVYAAALLGSAITEAKVGAIWRLMRPAPAHRDIAFVMDTDRAGWSGYDQFCQITRAQRVHPWMLRPGVKDFCGVPPEDRGETIRWWLQEETV